MKGFKRFSSGLVTLFDRQMEDQSIINKAVFSPGAVDKREDAESFSLEKLDVISDGESEFEVQETHPLVLKDVKSGKIINVKGNKKFKILSSKKNRPFTTLFIFSVVKDFPEVDLSSKDKFSSFAKDIGLKVESSLRRDFYVMGDEDYQKVVYQSKGYSPKLGDKVVLQSDLFSGYNLSSPIVRKKIVELDDAKALLEDATGNTYAVSLNEFSNINSKKFSEVLKSFGSNWKRYVKKGKLDLKKISCKDNYETFVVDSFKGSPNSLKEMMSRSVYSKIVDFQKSRFKRGDRVQLRTSNQRGVFISTDRASGYGESRYAWVTFGKNEDPVRVLLSDLDDLGYQVRLGYAFGPEVSIAKQLYVYIMDNEKPIKERFDDWTAGLADLLAEYIDNNSLFMGVDYVQVMKNLKDVADSYYQPVLDNLSKKLLAMGYNKITQASLQVSAANKSLKFDKELVAVNDQGDMLNRKFKDVWAVEEEEDGERYIKFI